MRSGFLIFIFSVTAIAVTGVFIAVADGIAVTIGFAALRRRLIPAFADIVNIYTAGGGNAGVGIGLPIAATDRVKEGDTDFRPREAFTDLIALPVCG